LTLLSASPSTGTAVTVAVQYSVKRVVTYNLSLCCLLPLTHHCILTDLYKSTYGESKPSKRPWTHARAHCYRRFWNFHCVPDHRQYHSSPSRLGIAYVSPYMLPHSIRKADGNQVTRIWSSNQSRPVQAPNKFFRIRRQIMCPLPKQSLRAMRTLKPTVKGRKRFGNPKTVQIICTCKPYQVRNVYRMPHHLEWWLEILSGEA
jgi:hypothetical protein